MTGGTITERKNEDDDYLCRSEDESANTSTNASRASTGKRKKKRSSTGSTAASTNSSVAKRKASKKKAMKKVDNLMSNLTGISDHSKNNVKQKQNIPKNSTRSLKEHFETNSKDKSVLDDVASCLTENSKSTKGTARSKSRKKKKRSSSKKSRNVHAIDENQDQHSPTNKSVGSKRSKSRSKKKVRSISSPRSNHDDEFSTSSETSNSKRSRTKKNDLSKLDRRDRLYHSKSNSSSSPYHSREDDKIDKNSIRRTKSLPLNTKTPTPTSRLAAKKKAKTFGKDGNVRLKILADGSVKASVPKRSLSVDKSHILRANQIDEGNDSDSVSLSDSSDEEKGPSRRGMRATLDRSMSLQQVRKMALVTKRNNSYTPASSASPPSRNPPPARFAARGNSIKVRSASADHVRDMQRYLVRNSSNQSLESSRNASTPNSKNVRLYVAPSPSEAPLRRGVNRNSSAPLRSAMRSPSYSARAPIQQRGPLRSTKSAYLQQTQRRPPARRNSKDLSTAEHVAMLTGFHFDNSQRRRSSSQPTNDLEGIPGGSRRGRRPPSARSLSRSLSPNRGILRSSSHGSVRSYSSKGSYGSYGNLDHLSKSDLDPGDLEGSMVLHHNNEDDGCEQESLNDSRHIIGMDRRDLSRNRSQKLRRDSSDGSLFGYSTHSLQSNRSQMSIDKPEPFENDPKWKAALRYIYLLPPFKNESKLKKKTRLFTWIAMLLDFIAAIVAVAQYGGSTKCCGEPVFDIILKIDWDALFRVVTYLYMFMIPAEIIPVIKNGIPFNIVNPGIGLIITFGMFFDDSIAEAVAMWMLEALAIFMEFMVYRVNARMYFETSFKLDQVDEEIEALKKKRKEFVERLQGGEFLEGGSMHGSRHRTGSRHSHGSRPSLHSRDGSRNNTFRDLEMGRRSTYDDEDEDSLSGHSFGGDEDFDDEAYNRPPRAINSRPPPEQIRRTSKLRRTKSRDVLGSSTHSNGASTTVTGITGMTGAKIRLPGEIKQNKLLRRRRLLRENKTKEKNELHYHFVGSILNVSLAVIAMIFIITIASTGGLCFKDNRINVFSFQQLEICNNIDVTGELDKYENCDDPDDRQCYIPYY